MPTTLEQTASQFEALAKRIEKVWVASYPIGTPLNQSLGWQASALAPQDAINLANAVAERIRGMAYGKEAAKVDAGAYWVSLAKQADGLDFANFASDPISVIRSTFEFLLFVSNELPTLPMDLDWEHVSELPQIPKRLSSRLRALEARLDGLEPRASAIDQKILVIENAHDAAERLPTDLEELRNSVDEINELQTSASQASFRIGELLRTSTGSEQKITDLNNSAAALVQKCEEAYRITTSAGLAGAFEYRSRSLAKVGWVWVAILVSSLVAAVWLGKDRYDGLRSLLTGEHPPALIYLNILFAVLGVAAPVWLAWLATRSIGQSFRLSEDYAFKASVSKAYEGYRKEAVSLDEEFARRLFGSALTRLDEAPSRFIVSEDHNTPLQELLDNESFKKFSAAFPEVKDQLVRYLVDAKSVVAGAVGGAVASARPAPKAQKERVKEDPSSSDTVG